MSDPYRLPHTVTPRHYALSLAPDLVTNRFEGTVTIAITVHQPVSEIVLNAAELEIRSAVLHSARGEQAGTVTLDAELERATVALSNRLTPGDATLVVAFTGTINDALRGFYRSVFRDADGRERVIATTQFESTDARRAFPCWDEPEHKATFQVSLLVPDGLLGLSNTAAVESRTVDGGTWVTFDRTMKMSTYLVAFVVGPLVTTATVDVDGVPLRVACVPGREHLATWALEAGAHALRFMAQYFAIPYPAGKLDLVALPDFAAGAMENLGCITFRETALLVDRENASRSELESVAETVAHEIAHMWFGDLVTMRWWNDIWLNEAFATFMELTTVNDFRPSWGRWAAFVIERNAAMAIDGLTTTRPIEYEVVSPDDAHGMFDALTYQKGAAVLRMLEQHLGAERFRDGIRLYLHRHSYGNTEAADLWRAIEEATGEPVRAIMDSWILQGGHPLVSAALTGDDLQLSQSRFRYLATADDADARWMIPVRTRSLESGTQAAFLLSERSLAVPAHNNTVLVNAGGWGVYRTSYEQPLFETLRERFPGLETLERLALASDAWAMALAGRTTLTAFVDLVALLMRERNPHVWDVGLEGIDALHRAMAEGARVTLSAWVRALAGPTFESLGWTPTSDEGEDAARLRGRLLGCLGTLGADQTVIARARDLHAAVLAGEATVDAELLAPIVSTVAWNGEAAEYEVFWDRIRHAATPQEEVRYLYRLPLFPSAELLQRTLDATLTEVRRQNGAFVIAGCLANRAAGRLAWDWLTAHWDDVADLIEISHGRLLQGVVRLTDADAVQNVAVFLGEHPIRSARRQIAQYLERQQINAAFAVRAAGTDLHLAAGQE